MARKKPRFVLSLGAAILAGGALTAAFWPRAVMVDMSTVTRASMIVTIDAEGRTQVHNTYVVSTPMAGRLQRVEMLPGDKVVRGQTVVAHMLPINPEALDVRTREQARAAVTAAEAALRVARAEQNGATASNDLAQTDLARTRALTERGVSSKAALERAEQAARVAIASFDTAKAAIAVREAELANAHALLIGFDDQGLASAIRNGGDSAIPLLSPTNGRILRVIQKSETTLPAGTPVIEIGNIEDDLEIVVDLLSSDAVQVSIGNRVLIEDWGGAATLTGEVTRIDPFGVTQYSALGVEEQRVNTMIRFIGPVAQRANLGHGFRVEVRIVIWEEEGTLVVPSSALFRDGDDWAVFTVEENRAQLHKVLIGKNNGVQAQVIDGLDEGARIILFPSSAVTDGMRVAQRSGL